MGERESRSFVTSPGSVNRRRDVTSRKQLGEESATRFVVHPSHCPKKSAPVDCEARIGRGRSTQLHLPAAWPRDGRRGSHAPWRLLATMVYRLRPLDRDKIARRDNVARAARQVQRQVVFPNTPPRPWTPEMVTPPVCTESISSRSSCSLPVKSRGRRRKLMQSRNDWANTGLLDIFVAPDHVPIDSDLASTNFYAGFDIFIH